MDIQQRRNNLAQFIIGSFDPYDFDRAKRYPNNRIGQPFATYNDFRNYQIHAANNIDINTLNFAEQLMLLIEGVGMAHVDKEDMILFPISGFMFINGRFITFNER